MHIEARFTSCSLLVAHAMIYFLTLVAHICEYSRIHGDYDKATTSSSRGNLHMDHQTKEACQFKNQQ